MNDQFPPPGWYLRPETWPYWMSNAQIGASTPSSPTSDPWGQSTPSAAETPSRGILGNFGQPMNGLSTDPRTAISGLMARDLPTLPHPFALPPAYSPALAPDSWNQSSPTLWHVPTGANVGFPASPAQRVDEPPTDPSPEISGVTMPNSSNLPPIKPKVPFYGPDGVLRPEPEPAPPAPPKDFRTWLHDALSDANVRYYAGPGFYEALEKLRPLTQLLPGSSSVQSLEDTSRANEERHAGHYGNAAAHFGMGTVNAALDWLPASKLAIIGGNKLAIIAGTMARTFPWNRLPTAMRMEAGGRSADEVWRATGLERAADSRWTFEIPDKGYRVHPKAGEPTNWDPLTVAPLYEHHAHPGMREAYPQLANWPSLLGIEPLQRPLGRAGEQLIVSAPDLPTARSIGIHELKHLIDNLEIHPPGGPWRQFMGPGVSEQEARDRYRRLIGEVAARNAQRRLLMSERERRLRSPQSTESVPRDQQINLYDE